MSLGSISRPKHFSDAHFVGDLASLFKRQRIEAGDAASIAGFESCLASNDSFRSKLFTLCTAISHMSEEDLSGEQLLDLIARALGVPEASGDGVEIPESMRAAFLSGYQAWSNRDLNEPAPWPPLREPAANEPIPFPQPAASLAEPATTDRRAPEAHPPGMRTVQEALLMARKQTPFELPARSTPVPASTPGVNIEELTITELTKLLDDIERRMSRIKPHFQELNALAHPPEETFERPAGTRDIGEATYSKAMVPAAQLGPSLVAAPNSSASLSPIETASIAAPYQLVPSAEAVPTRYQEDMFIARHQYLRPGRRLPPDTIVPIPLATPPPAPIEIPRAELPAKPAEAVVASVDNVPERIRVKMHLAIGVAAALILVASPLAGFVAYKLLHPTYVIEYQDVKPSALSSGDAAAPSPAPEPPAAAPASAPAQKAQRSNGAGSGSKNTSRNPQNIKRAGQPVAVWPLAPQK